MSTMKIGSKGKDVVSLQEALTRAKVKPRIEADGIYGKSTAAAVKAFQKKAGLKADGVAGSDTMQCLGNGSKTSKASDMPSFDIPDMKPLIKAQQKMGTAEIQSHEKRAKFCRNVKHPIFDSFAERVETNLSGVKRVNEEMITGMREIEHLRKKFEIVEGKDARRAQKFVDEARKFQADVSLKQRYWEGYTAEKRELDSLIARAYMEHTR